MIIVERIEENIAVLESDGKTLIVPLNKLPNAVHEGSVLVKIAGGFAIDEQAEKKRHSLLTAKRHRIFKK
ncbi:MAG: DUF3006 domain-containing protein [Oscillospiraceae bacterium]